MLNYRMLNHRPAQSNSVRDRAGRGCATYESLQKKADISNVIKEAGSGQKANSSQSEARFCATAFKREPDIGTGSALMTKWVYGFGGGTAEGRADMRDLLGGKGAGLAEISNLGLPV